MASNCGVKFFVKIRPIIFVILAVTFFVEVQSDHKLDKEHLLIAATRAPLVKPTELTTIGSGLMEKIYVAILSHHLNFTYEIRPPLDSLSPGYLLKNGSWTGTAGQLQRREVDMCVSAVAPASAKRSIMEISQPVEFVETGIIIPFPDENSKIWIDDSVFQPNLWIAVIVSFSAMVCSAWIIELISLKSNKLPNSRHGFVYWIFFFFGIWTSQGTSSQPSTSAPFRLLLFGSVLGVYITCNYFTASYTSFLSIPSFRTTVHSVEDLANSGTVKTLIIKGSSTDEYIRETTDPTMKKIAKQMERYPERRILNAFTVEDISTIVKDDLALVIVKRNGQSLVEQSYELNNKTCRVTMVDQGFFSRPQTFTYPKDSPIVASFDKEILWMHQAGLFIYAENQAKSKDPCSLANIKRIKAGKVASFTLSDVSGVFVIFGAGAFISSLVFICEIALFNVNHLQQICVKEPQPI